MLNNDTHSIFDRVVNELREKKRFRRLILTLTSLQRSYQQQQTAWTAKAITPVCTAAYISPKDTDTWAFPAEMLRTGFLTAQAEPNHATSNGTSQTRGKEFIFQHSATVLDICSWKLHLTAHSQHQHGVSPTEILQMSAQIPQDQRFTQLQC